MVSLLSAPHLLCRVLYEVVRHWPIIRCFFQCLSFLRYYSRQPHLVRHRLRDWTVVICILCLCNSDWPSLYIVVKSDQLTIGHLVWLVSDLYLGLKRLHCTEVTMLCHQGIACHLKSVVSSAQEVFCTLPHLQNFGRFNCVCTPLLSLCAILFQDAVLLRSVSVFFAP